MIEALMLFTLGFLMAVGLALTVMPLVWRWASQYTRRRVTAEMPVSLAQIRASRDQIRAEYAMRVRQLEIGIDEAKRRLSRQVVEIGRRTETTANLRLALEDQQAIQQATDAELAAERADNEAARTRIGELEDRLAEITRLQVDAETQLRDLRGLASEAEAMLEHRDALITERDERIAALQDELAELEIALDDSRSGVAEARTLREGSNEALEDALSQNERLHGNIEEAEEKYQQLLDRLRAIEAERDGAQAARDAARHEQREAAERAERAESLLAERDAAIQTLRVRLAKSSAEHEGLRADIDEQRVAFENYRTTARAEIEGLQSERRELMRKASVKEVS